MIQKRNVTIILDSEGNSLVLVNDIVFKGKRSINWDEVKAYLEQYIGDYYEIEEAAEKIYIGNKFPYEFTGSESRKLLMGGTQKPKLMQRQQSPN